MEIFSKIREKLSYRRYFFVVTAALFIFLAGALFVGIQPDSASTGDGAVPPAPAVSPLPTAMDPSFDAQIKDCFLPIASLYGYDLRVTSGFRTVEEQEAVYQLGRTEIGHIVTEAPGGKSIHNYGFAVDVADRARGYDINWVRLRKISEYCGLEENDEVGDWPHFENRGGLTVDDFAAGKRPGTLVLPCLLMSERAAADQQLTLLDLKDCGAPEF